MAEKLSMEEVKQLLSALDKNDDGKVSADELQHFLSTPNCKIDKEKLEMVIARHDKDKDGKLDLNELADLLAGH
ncbi:unnamed protein product [Dicrocoelium dendriticum]|nr:unnamed protein product [Dicrocoelium dendriticum]